MHRLAALLSLPLLLGACAHERALISPEEEVAAVNEADEATAGYLGPAGSDWIDLPIVSPHEVMDPDRPGHVWWRGLMKQLHAANERQLGDCMLDQAEREPGLYEWSLELRLEAPTPGVLRVAEVVSQAGPTQMDKALECYRRKFEGVEARRPGVDAGERLRIRQQVRYRFTQGHRGLY